MKKGFGIARTLAYESHFDGPRGTSSPRSMHPSPLKFFVEVLWFGVG
jgi:hypothetical protein